MNPVNKHLVLQETIAKLVRRGARQHLENLLNKVHPADTANVLRHSRPPEAEALFRVLIDRPERAEVLSALAPEEVSEFLSNLESKKIAKILEDMSSDDAADVIGALPENLATDVLKIMEDKGSETVEKLLEYPEDSAGGIMTPHCFALDEDITAGEAIRKVQEAGDAEMVFYLYVVDKHDHLLGVVSLRQLLTVSPETPLSKIMSPRVLSVKTHEDQEEVARQVTRYNLLAIPVVTEENKLVGIVTVDDVIDVIREEATEDFLKMAGTTEEDVTSGSVLHSARLRIPWLFASWIGGITASLVISNFSKTLTTFIALGAFIPIIMGMGGNIGTQSSTTVIRGLALGQVSVKQLWQVLFRELRVGLLLGIIYGLLLAAFAQIRYHNLNMSLVVFLAMTSSMTLASSLGTFTPMTLARFGVDPAVASGPFVTTITDVTVMVIYFILASILMNLVLPI